MIQPTMQAKMAKVEPAIESPICKGELLGGVLPYLNFVYQHLQLRGHKNMYVIESMPATQLCMCVRMTL